MLGMSFAKFAERKCFEVVVTNAATTTTLCRDDMEMMLNKIVPEGLPYRHSCEGPDDMVTRACSPFAHNTSFDFAWRALSLNLLYCFDP